MSILKVGALLAVLLTGLPQDPARAGDWEVITEREGIVVSRRSAPGRGFPELRAVGEVPGTPYEVLAILVDVPGYAKWLPDCLEAKTVRKIDEWRSFIYTRTDVPWPVPDRDVVVDNQVIFTEPPFKVSIAFSAVKAPDVGRRQGVVRMSKATGFYAVEAIDESRSLVHYQVDADPGGILPDWLISMQSTRNPFETLAGLRRRLVETRGQYREQIGEFPAGKPAPNAEPR